MPTWEQIGSLAVGVLAVYQGIKTKEPSLSTGGIYLLYRGVTGHCFIREGLLQWSGQTNSNNMNIKKSVKVSHPPNVVYLFWKRFQEFPQMVKYIKRVEKFRGDRAIWTVNRFICWESEIVHDDPNVRIGWRTIPGSTITHYGNVHFEEIKEGKTKVTVVISYLVPFGKAGKAVVKLFNPLIGSILKREMIRLKKFIKSS